MSLDNSFKLLGLWNKKEIKQLEGNLDLMKRVSFCFSFVFSLDLSLEYGTIPHASSEHVKGESREREAGPEQRKTQDRKGATAWAVLGKWVLVRELLIPGSK